MEGFSATIRICGGRGGRGEGGKGFVGGGSSRMGGPVDRRKSKKRAIQGGAPLDKRLAVRY